MLGREEKNYEYIVLVSRICYNVFMPVIGLRWTLPPNGEALYTDTHRTERTVSLTENSKIEHEKSTPSANRMLLFINISSCKKVCKPVLLLNVLRTYAH